MNSHQELREEVEHLREELLEGYYSLIIEKVKLYQERALLRERVAEAGEFLSHLDSEGEEEWLRLGNSLEGAMDSRGEDANAKLKKLIHGDSE